MLSCLLLTISAIGILSRCAANSYAVYTMPTGAKDVSGMKTTPGMAMIGGGPDCTPAFSWIIDHANGGDLVVLRASGDDAYNPAFYDLSVSNGQPLNSVTTIVCNDRNASYDPTVLALVEQAEAVFFSGGDQGLYLRLWANTPLQRLLQSKLTSVTMGGTSAGLAIQGEWVYSADNGSAYSDESLLNPYNMFITIADAFLHIPHLQNTITDTHFGARDRMGRLTAFMARIQTDTLRGRQTLRGIALDEQTALLLDATTGAVTTVGPNHGYVCAASGVPQVCQPDSPLRWEESIHCTRLSGPDGDTYSFATWSGQGVRYDNNVVDGKFTSPQYGP